MANDRKVRVRPCSTCWAESSVLRRRNLRSITTSTEDLRLIFYQRHAVELWIGDQHYRCEYTAQINYDGRIR